MPKKANEKTNVENNLKSNVKNITKKSKATYKPKSTSKPNTKVTSNSALKVTTTTVKKASKTKAPIVEYYDLPNLYNQTTIKILAQTPTVLFVYWDISSEDQKIFLEKYGEDFFDTTIPYLCVKNITRNYTFDVEINDYANSWYINISDSDCKYDVVLFRKPKTTNNQKKPICIASSNNLQTPNDHILFDSFGKTIFFKNIKTDEVETKNTTTLSFMNNVGQIYNIYDLYKKIYKNELSENKLDTNLPSS